MKMLKNLVVFSIIISSGLSAIAQMTSFEAIEKMTCGINVGRSLELSNEGDAGNRYIQEYYFTDFKTAGFNFVRIPIQWDQHTGTTPPYIIDDSWLDRVEQVIDWSLKHGLITIINSHHDKWILEDSNYSASDLERFKAIWDQVAFRFKDKSDSLIFEIANEPNIAISKTDQLNSSVIPIIRGSNPTRLIVFGSSGTQLSTLKQAVIPDDDYLIASFHTYVPWSFAGQGNGTWGTTSEINAVKSLMADAATWSENHNIPMLLGEFGTVGKSETNSRMKWFYYHLQEARRYNIAPAVWQDFGDFSIYFYTTNPANKWNTVIKDIIVYTQPQSPDSVSITVVNGAKAQLEWNNRADDYKWTKVERKEGNGKYISLNTAEGTANSYLDETSVAGKTYTYRVGSELSTGEITYSFPVTKTIESSTSSFNIKQSNDKKMMVAYFSDEVLNIRMNSTLAHEKTRYQIITSTGQIIKSGVIHSNAFHVQTAGFSKGIYFVNVTTRKGLNLSQKVVKF